MLQLEDIESEWIDPRTKGIPGKVSPFRLGDIGKQQWNILNQDLPLPLLVLKESALEQNLKRFQRYCENKGVDLAPHGKTTMCPQLFQKQIEHGAWGMTVATVSQMQVYRSIGLQRILLANQLVGRQAIETVVQYLNDDPEFEFFSLVDSVGLVEYLAQELDRAGLKKPLRLLLEFGQMGGRCGCRSFNEARQICQALASRPDLFTLVGFELYEGILSTASKAQQFLDESIKWIQDLADEISPSCPEILLTAGGSHYFDLVVQSFQSLNISRPRRMVLRSGCYLTHDHGAYEDAQEKGKERGNWPSDLQPALELWSCVQSRPEDTLAILTMGKRDCPYDAGMPVVQGLYRPGTGWMNVDVSAVEVTHLNDQHGYLKLPADSSLRVGDMVMCGISHPCTAFDKWKFIPGVDDQYNVVTGYRTFF